MSFYLSLTRHVPRNKMPPSSTSPSKKFLLLFLHWSPCSSISTKKPWSIGINHSFHFLLRCSVARFMDVIKTYQSAASQVHNRFVKKTFVYQIIIFFITIIIISLPVTHKYIDSLPNWLNYKSYTSSISQWYFLPINFQKKHSRFWSPFQTTLLTNLWFSFLLPLFFPKHTKFH